MLEDAVYLFQIVVLIVSIYMIWRTRRLINGLARGLIVLFVFLIVQRIDFAFNIYDENISLVVSSMVVLAVAYDIYQVYRMIPTYEVYWRNRQERITRLENMRKTNEARKRWDDERIERWL